MKRSSADIVTLLLFAVSPVLAEVQTKTVRIGTTIVHYKVVLPNGFDSAKMYPAVLAFGGASQTMETVDRAIQRNWQKEAESRGYIVILPAAPDGVLFFQGGEKIFPELLVMILGTYKIQDNKFHAAGYSNGGTSAFLVAASYPQYFLSVTAFPGYLLRETPANLSNISKLCIHTYVGDRDPSFLNIMQNQAGRFHELGIDVKFTIEKGQGHILETLSGAGAARLFDDFDKGCTRGSPSQDHGFSAP